MDLQLKGKVALITGGSIGIGLAVAKGLAKEGVHLVLCARNEARLQEEAKQIQAEYKVDVLSVKCDVSKAEDINQLVENKQSQIWRCRYTH